ncbi:MAG: dihydropteroate synthase [Candidatus Syntrophosphaera sp.]|nr:dihydropteroate synthase [Candidatus Syntrophosphaera sp.]
MGILNITEDSFSDGGSFLDPGPAFMQAEKMIADGADILDIGGESTRPGSRAVDEETEMQRVLPVLARISESHPDLTISVDTRKSGVAEKAIASGAAIINDISALRFDSRMSAVLVANPEVKLIITHMQGEPETMQEDPRYEDVLESIDDFFAERIAFAATRGISRKRIMLDPGIGFGKDLSHNLRILANLGKFRRFDLPLVVGASRKRFINAVNPSDTTERIGGSLAAAWISALQGVQIVRVHDVKAHRQFFDTLLAITGEKL